MKYLTVWLAIAMTSQLGAQAPGGRLSNLPPVGFGSLHQADVSVLLQTENIQISLLPLDERITRLLAPDTYRSLEGIKTAKREAIVDAAPFGTEGLQIFLVTVYATRQRTQFDPERVTITNNGRYFRPTRIVPVTPRWGEHQLESRESSSALYLFDQGLDPLEPMIVEYGTAVDVSWEQTLRRLEAERARVEARARGTLRPGTKAH